MTDRRQELHRKLAAFHIQEMKQLAHDAEQFAKNYDPLRGHSKELAMTNELIKDTNPKDSIGATKPPLSVLPMPVIYEVAAGLHEGALKYGRHNYRVFGVRASVYFDATMRHLMAWWEGEDIDPESGLSHIGKAISSLVVLRDAMMQEGMLNDDRPPRAQQGWMDRAKADTKALLERYPEPKAPYTEQGCIAPAEPPPRVRPVYTWGCQYGDEKAIEEAWPEDSAATMRRFGAPYEQGMEEPTLPQAHLLLCARSRGGGNGSPKLKYQLFQDGALRGHYINGVWFPASKEEPPRARPVYTATAKGPNGVCELSWPRGTAGSWGSFGAPYEQGMEDPTLAQAHRLLQIRSKGGGHGDSGLEYRLFQDDALLGHYLGGAWYPASKED